MANRKSVQELWLQAQAMMREPSEDTHLRNMLSMSAKAVGGRIQSTWPGTYISTTSIASDTYYLSFSVMLTKMVETTILGVTFKTSGGLRYTPTFVPRAEFLARFYKELTVDGTVGTPKFWTASEESMILVYPVTDASYTVTIESSIKPVEVTDSGDATLWFPIAKWMDLPIILGAAYYVARSHKMSMAALYLEEFEQSMRDLLGAVTVDKGRNYTLASIPTERGIRELGRPVIKEEGVSGDEAIPPP